MDTIPESHPTKKLRTNEQCDPKNFKQHVLSTSFSLKHKIVANSILLNRLGYKFDPELTGIKRIQFDEHLVSGINAFFKDNYNNDAKRIIFEKIIRPGFPGYDARKKNVVVQGYNAYKHVKGGWMGKISEKRQEENTSVFKGYNIDNVVNSCQQLKELFHKIQRDFNLNIIKFHLLRQSTNGKNGAKEALFEWHKDNENEELEAFITIIVSLAGTKTSM